MTTPAEVVAALTRDRISGFNALYGEYADQVYGRLTSYGADPAIAAKATSNTLLIAVGNVGRLQNLDSLPQWLDAVADNEALKNGLAANAIAPDQAAPPELHGEVASSLGQMLQSGFLPDVGPVDDAGFPLAFDPNATQIISATDQTDPADTQMLGEPAGAYDSPSGPPPPPPVGAAPIIPPVAADDPVAVSTVTEATNRRWLIAAVIVAVVVIGLGIFGVLASGIGTSSNDEPTDVPTLPTLTPTNTNPTIPPISPTAPPTTPTAPPTTPTAPPTTPTAPPTTPTVPPTSPTAPTGAPTEELPIGP